MAGNGVGPARVVARVLVARCVVSQVNTCAWRSGDSVLDHGAAGWVCAGAAVRAAGISNRVVAGMCNWGRAVRVGKWSPALDRMSPTTGVRARRPCVSPVASAAWVLEHVVVIVVDAGASS